jgi:hypothetical protein
MDEAVKAVYLEMVGQTFAVLGMAIAKLSLGIFLLRIVLKPWHRISIWVSMVSLSLVSVVTAIIFWIQRLPSNSIYDPRVPGRTVVAVTPFSVWLGCMPFRTLPSPSSIPLIILIIYSMVCGGRLLLRDSAMDIHLGAEHEVQGEDDDRYQFELRIHVRNCYI